MDKKRMLSAQTVARLSAGGLAAGVVNGIFGNGGGVVVVFLFSSMASILFSTRREIFSNVTAAVLPIALTSALVYSSVSPPKASDAVAVGAASLAGGIAGAMLLGRIDPRALKIIFAVLMVISGILMIV